MLALDSQDSGEVRFHKIVDLISTCQYGIHDLSRCTAEEKGEFFRLNMPLELGLDLGARYFGSDQLRKKKCLIMETERYRYQKAISDIGGSDIKAHKNSPDEVIRIIRDWLVTDAKPRWCPPASEILARYFDFLADEHDRIVKLVWQPNEVARIQVPEFKRNAGAWIRRNYTIIANKGSLPVGIKIKGSPGLVHSPYDTTGRVDVKGIPKGTKVECPYTGGHFLVPSQRPVPTSRSPNGSAVAAPRPSIFPNFPLATPAAPLRFRALFSASLISVGAPCEIKLMTHSRFGISLKRNFVSGAEHRLGGNVGNN